MWGWRLTRIVLNELACLLQRSCGRSGPGDLFGIKQSGKGALTAMCLNELLRHPPLMEQARAAAAEVLSSQQLTPALKAALLAYGFWISSDADPGGAPGAGLSSSSSMSSAHGAGKSGVTGV